MSTSSHPPPPCPPPRARPPHCGGRSMTRRGPHTLFIIPPCSVRGCCVMFLSPCLSHRRSKHADLCTGGRVAYACDLRVQERSWGSTARLPASICETARLPALSRRPLLRLCLACVPHDRAHRLTATRSRRVIKTLTGQHMNVRCGAGGTVRDLKAAVAAQAVRSLHGLACATCAPPPPSHLDDERNAGLGGGSATPDLRREAA